MSETSRVSLRTLLAEAAAGITERPGRSALTALGTLIGVAVLVTVLSLTSSASVQVSRQFDLQEATLVTVGQEPRRPTRVRNLLFPDDVEQRVARINGVTCSGLYWKVDGVEVRAGAKQSSSEVLAGTTGLADVAQVDLTAGRMFDAGHHSRSSRVAVIGSGVAHDLGIGDLSRLPAVELDGVPFTVIGILSDTKRIPGLLGAVLVPASTARQIWHDPAPEFPPQLAVSVRPGAARVVGEQLPQFIAPAQPDEFVVTFPPDPTGLREMVDQQLSGLMVLLALVCLVVGVVGIANTTFVAVVERTGEIGLRRAMGARPSHILTQFLSEAAVLGMLGGLIGTAIGVCVVVAVSATIGWTAVVPLEWVAVGPVVGLLSGVLGGSVPARRASRIEPVDALRG